MENTLDLPNRIDIPFKHNVGDTVYESHHPDLPCIVVSVHLEVDISEREVRRAVYYTVSCGGILQEAAESQLISKKQRNDIIKMYNSLDE